MRIKRIAPQEPQPTHLLAVTPEEIKALRRAVEAYITDEHRLRSPFYKPVLNEIINQLNDLVNKEQL